MPQRQLRIERPGVSGNSLLHFVKRSRRIALCESQSAAQCECLRVGRRLRQHGIKPPSGVVQVLGGEVEPRQSNRGGLKRIFVLRQRLEDRSRVGFAGRSDVILGQKELR